MKSKFCLVIFMFGYSFGVHAADIRDFFDPVFPVEQQLQRIAGFNKVGRLSARELSDAFVKGGIKFSDRGVFQLKNAIAELEFIITNRGSFNSASLIHSHFQSNRIPIDPKEAQVIFDHLNGRSRAGQNAHVFLISVIANKTDAVLRLFLQAIADPQRPNSAAKRAIDNVLKKTSRLIKFDFKPQLGIPGLNSGENDWFSNAYAEVGTSYTAFDDIEANGSGKENSFNLTVGGDVGADSIVAFSLSKTYSHRGGDTSLTFESHGGDLMFHHKINEYFGAGMYGFFQNTDIHEFEGHAYAYGGGLLVTGMYDFGYFDVSTVQTLNKVWHKFGHDQLYVGSFNINRNWTDSLSTVFRASYTDSLKTDVDDDGDNSYWSVGGDLNWVIDDNASFSIGYERIVALTDYRSHTINLSFRWYF
ncbi:MAG: hypothetical protein NE327_05965 [Lentisphaeraceae bacterium]|nr:hypothetical protein [Lentisphaeraceae bacterium]